MYPEHDAGKCLENGEFDNDCCAVERAAGCVEGYQYHAGYVCWATETYTAVRSFCVPVDENNPETPVDPQPEGDYRDGYNMADDAERALWADEIVDWWYWEMADLDFTDYGPDNLHTSIIKRYYEDYLLMGGGMYEAKYVGRTDYVLDTPLYDTTEAIRAGLKADASRGGVFQLRNVRMAPGSNIFFDIDLLTNTLPEDGSVEALNAL